MRDCVVPGGVAADLVPAKFPVLRSLLAEIRARFPALVTLYDNTASLQDRTVATGILKPELALQFGAGGYVGRASGRDFDARRDFPYPPYDRLSFDVPVLQEGDVNARVWIRIQEVEQSLALIDQILARLPAGPVRAPIEPQAGEGIALVEGFRGDILVWLRIGPDGRDRRAAICAIRPGSTGRCWRPRSRATSSPTSRSATSRSTAPIPAAISRGFMRKHLFQGIIRPPLTEPLPPPRRGTGRAGAGPRSRRTANASAAASRSARSMPVPAMAASWRSPRCPTPSTIWSVSACASSPRRATPTCCW